MLRYPLIFKCSQVLNKKSVHTGKKKKKTSNSYIFVTTGGKKFMQKPFTLQKKRGITGKNFTRIGVTFGAGC